MLIFLSSVVARPLRSRNIRVFLSRIHKHPSNACLWSSAWSNFMLYYFRISYIYLSLAARLSLYSPLSSLCHSCLTKINGATRTHLHHRRRQPLKIIVKPTTSATV
ncbi:hypothetical protein ABFX02_04G140400 [Erythranthe guttata]